MRTQLFLPHWLDQEDVEYLRARWTVLQPFAGSPIFYRSNRSYDGQYQNSPAQIEHSVGNQLDCMVDGRVPKVGSSLGQHVVKELVQIRRLLFPAVQTVPYRWLASEFWNNPDNDTHRSLRPYKKAIEEILSHKNNNLSA